jgi:hypothetical protein
MELSVTELSWLLRVVYHKLQPIDDRDGEILDGNRIRSNACVCACTVYTHIHIHTAWNKLRATDDHTYYNVWKGELCTYLPCLTIFDELNTCSQAVYYKYVLHIFMHAWASRLADRIMHLLRDRIPPIFVLEYMIASALQLGSM